VRSQQLALPMGDEPEARPILYLACPLTAVDPATRKLVDSWCTHICNTVTETAAESGDPWEIGVHAPWLWSNPARGDGREPDAIYTLNSHKVRESAGVIVLSLAGGSTGIGQELAWAVALRLPVLYLHPHDEPASRQVLGTPGDLEVVAFEDAADLVDAVRRFLRSRRSVIEDRARRALGESVKFAALRVTLAEEWDRRGNFERSRVQAEARIHQARIAELLEDDNSLGMASLSELAALAGALSASLASLGHPDTPPELGDREREALVQACDEYDWSGSKALDLERSAQLEVARGGTRRLTLQSPEDWIRFDRRRHERA